MVAEPKKNSDLPSAGEALQDIADALREAAAGIVRLKERIRQVESSIAAANSMPNEVAVYEFQALPEFSVVSETRSHVPTATAAAWLSRSPQTLRKWACYEDGPIRPVRINGRLAWPVVEIRRVLGRGDKGLIPTAS